MNNAGVPSSETDDEFTNAYAYLSLRQVEPLEVTVGLAWEKVLAPLGLILPRDSQIGAGEVSFDKSQVSPKIGLSLYLPTRTTLRGAWYKRLSPALGRIQTLEPTQIVGVQPVLP